MACSLGGQGALHALPLDSEEMLVLQEADAAMDLDDSRRFAEGIVSTIYKHCCPEKLSNVPEFLISYSGRYPSLVARVASKYKVDRQRSFACMRHGYVFSLPSLS